MTTNEEPRVAYECKILADSITPEWHRLTTFEVTFPRFILAEVNTHRMLAKNSASSRAIPVAKSIDAVTTDPFIPASFGRNRSGMFWDAVLNDAEAATAMYIWNQLLSDAVQGAQDLAGLEVHKSLANRVLEPYKWHTAIVTATDWGNFFALRTAENAQPEFREIATMMEEAYYASIPYEMKPDEWHTPLVDDVEIRLQATPQYETLEEACEKYWAKVSVGRCARTTHLTHHGVRDPEADVGLHDRLLENRHMSPFEHVARPFSEKEWNLVRSLQDRIRHRMETQPDSIDGRHADYLTRSLEYQGCLRGWHSARMDIPNEHDYNLVLEGAV
jgi:thymidylate synthase ThyX